MKAHSLFTVILIGITALSPLGAAEKQKKSDIGGFPFWTSAKRGHVNQFVPGLNAALQFTDAQQEQISAANAEFSNDEGVKAARSISKNDPNVTADQRDKARATLEAANTRLHEKINAILTPEQKALVEKINAAYAAAMEDTGIVYADKFATVKADEAARRRIQEEKNQDIEEQFLHKLDGILSPGQKEAMTRAAAEEEQRNLKAAAIKKPPPAK